MKRALSRGLIVSLSALSLVVCGVVLAAQPQPSTVLWYWSGGLTAHGAQVKVRLRTTHIPVQLTLAADGDANLPLRETTSDNYGIATFDITELKPATHYTYTITTKNGKGSGDLRTPGDGPTSFRLAFASCASTGSKSMVFDTIRKLNPLMFIHMGDLHYENITKNDVARFGQAYNAVLASPRQAALFQHVPVAYMWDDHDFGPNDSDRTSPSRTAALAAYRLFAPHFPLESATSDIHQAFGIGRVRVILTDTRANRAPIKTPDDGRRTMLGEEQVVWLEQELERAKDAPLVLWVNSVPWITKNNEKTIEGWAPFAKERTRIANIIATLGLTNRLVMLSGDAHQLALDNGTHSQYATVPNAPKEGFVVVHAAPLDRWTTHKGGPYTVGPFEQRGQFGVLDVDDNGTTLRATIQGYRTAGPVRDMTLTLTCAPGGCQQSK